MRKYGTNVLNAVAHQLEHVEFWMFVIVFSGRCSWKNKNEYLKFDMFKLMSYQEHYMSLKNADFFFQIFGLVHDLVYVITLFSYLAAMLYPKLHIHIR